MLNAVIRKGRQVLADPVLRRWLTARALGRTAGEPAFTAHRPPYLAATAETLAVERPAVALADLPGGAPANVLRVRLPGRDLELRPGDEDALMAADLPDIETRLGLHRFAWVPLMDADADPRWVGAIWAAWTRAFGSPAAGMEWHPYTAAERVANLLDFGRRHGLPGGAAERLAAHAPAIVAGLEWFGDHHTSNHCFNNGRGLYLLGLALGMPATAEAGRRVLEAEAERIFRPAGVLREASTHYHLLLTRSLASVWLAACRAGRAEAGHWQALLARALAVLPHFHLPGRFPLVGDISPDCPPQHLFGLLPGGDLASGWTGLLAEDDRRALGALRDRVAPVSAAELAVEGWLRGDFGPWSGLWHADPQGWSPMPGHGHQDCGAAELHFDGAAVFVDPGRGSYAQAGEADPFVAGASHGGLLLDGLDPYPQNRPYFAPAFRAAVAGPARLEALANEIRLVHGGYARLGVPEVERRWRFDGASMVIADRLTGRGRVAITRRLVTPHPVRVEGESAVVAAPSRRFRVRAGGVAPSLEATRLWHAYGSGGPATAIAFHGEAALPWSGELIVEEA